LSRAPQAEKAEGRRKKASRQVEKAGRSGTTAIREEWHRGRDHGMPPPGAPGTAANVVPLNAVPLCYADGGAPLLRRGPAEQSPTHPEKSLQTAQRSRGVARSAQEAKARRRSGTRRGPPPAHVKLNIEIRQSVARFKVARRPRRQSGEQRGRARNRDKAFFLSGCAAPDVQTAVVTPAAPFTRDVYAVYSGTPVTAKVR